MEGRPTMYPGEKAQQVRYLAICPVCNEAVDSEMARTHMGKEHNVLPRAVSAATVVISQD